MPDLLACVLTACDTKLCGQPELLLAVQDFVLPLVELGPEWALRVGDARLLLLWLEAAARHGASVDEYSGAALFLALQQHGASFLTRALEANVDDDVWTSVANHAVRQNQRALLELLHDNVPALRTPSALEIAADVGDVELLQWLHACRFGGSRVTETTLTRAARNASFAVIQWLVHTPDLWTSIPNKDVAVRRAMDYAARYGHFTVLQWLREHAPDVWWSRHAIGAALINGHFNVADWMFAGNQTRRVVSTCMEYEPSSPVLNLEIAKCEAFRNGDLRVLEWLRAHKLLDNLSRKRTTELAMNAGHVHVLDYVATHFPDQTTFFLSFTSACAAGGSIAAAQWAQQRGLLEFHSATMLLVAATHGHVAFMQWYWTVCQGEMSALTSDPLLAFKKTVVAGHVACARFLVEKELVEPTPVAMLHAAEHGHLEIVQWLVTELRPQIDASVFNRTLTAAMHEAAAHGHVHVVRWIYGMDGVSDLAPATLCEAARHGHVQMVQFLLQHTPAACAVEAPAAVAEAATHGHLRVVKCLLSHSPQPRDTCVSLAQRARDHGHRRVATWIDTYGAKQRTGLGV